MVAEYTVRWNGGRIGLGASVFHFGGTDSPSAAFAAANAIRSFFDTIKPLLPNTIQITPDPEIRNMTAAGVLTSVVSFTPPATVVGTGTGAWTNGSGGMIRWTTASVVGGRRLLGRTFIVPLNGSSFTGGNLTSAAIGSIVAAGNTLQSAMTANGTPLQVWSKKNAVTSDVIGNAVPSRPSTLRTRNDRE